MKLLLPKLAKYIVSPVMDFFPWQNHGKCDCCGRLVNFSRHEVVSKELKDIWHISPAIKNCFDNRETLICSECGSSFRVRRLAKTLVKIYTDKANCFKDLCNSPAFQSKNVAEINVCNGIHQFLLNLPHLYYSEYQGFKKLKKIRHENLETLTYPDNFFDLVITSETLEHIQNINNALTQLYRVIKPGGKHVFTVPVLLQRKTFERTADLPKSYHGDGSPEYRVYREFGFDIINLMEKYNFDVKMYYFNLVKNDFSFVFVCTKK